MKILYYLFLFLLILFLLIGLFYPLITKKKLLESFINNRDIFCQSCCLSNKNNKKCDQICVWGRVCNCCKSNNFLQ